MRHLQPESWPQPSGYSYGIEASGKQVFVAGLVGWDTGGDFPPGLVAQLSQALDNTLAVLAEAGAGPADVVRMTWYVRDLDEYRGNLREIGGVYRAKMGRHFPAMAVVGVSDLVEADAMLEIETTAVVDRDA